MTVIADDSGPEGIAGIIGGEATGCGPETTNVFLEAAYFDPIRTAATGRALGIVSDARFRFERGVDPAFVEPGAEIATAMILELCGGETSELVIAGKAPIRSLSVRFHLDRVKALAGVDIPADEQLAILEAIGFVVAGTDREVVAEVPSWRPDIHEEADLVEEIVRVYGLDKVAHVAMPRLETVTGRHVTVAQRRRFVAARTLAARGMNEAMTWSFLPREQAALFGGGAEALALANPISSELSDMRPSLLPNLIAAAGRNVARGFADLALFEVGQIYAGDRPEDERVSAAGIRRGMDGPRHWAAKRREVDLFDAKADAQAVLSALGAPVDKLMTFAEGPAWYHPGRVGEFRLGPKNRLAVFGEVHPRVLAGDGRRRAACRLRDRPERHSAAEEREDHAPRARRLAVPGGDARFRLRGGGRRPGGKTRPRRQGGGQGADRLGRGLRRFHRCCDRRGAKVGGDRGHAPAARADADRRGDREGRGRNRCGCEERHRRRAQDLNPRRFRRGRTAPLAR